MKASMGTGVILAEREISSSILSPAMLELVPDDVRETIRGIKGHIDNIYISRDGKKITIYDYKTHIFGPQTTFGYTKARL
jgi:hypothetical protein